MNVKLQLFLHTLKHRRLIITGVIIFVLIQLLVSIQLIASALDYDKIYKGVHINDVNVSGLTLPEAENLLLQTYEPRIQAMQVIIKSDEESETISPMKVFDSLKIEEAAREAFNEGRTGNFVSRIFNIASTSVNGKTFNIEGNYNYGKLQQLIGKFSLKVKKELIQNSYQIYEDKIVITLGSSGESLDEGALKQKLIDRMNSFESGEIELPVVVTKPDPINVDELHNKVYAEAKDAKYEVKDKMVSITSHVIGRDFDAQRLKDALISNNRDSGQIEIPLKLTYPKVYEDELKSKLFKDTIASFSTHYNLGDRDRSENIKIASSKINEVVLGPGEIFSYNNTVGERTIAEGFKKAHVYSGGKIIDGIGGGICQVSTTLYNAVLFADLEVVERKNHNMIVAYVPPGRDATVSYGSIDFKFKNSFKNPIKILTSLGGGSLKVEILGLKENPSRKIELATEIISSYSLPEKVIEDPTQPIGYYKVLQKSMKGYKAKTYKVIKENGKVISKTLISTNKYNALQRTVKKGTKQINTPSNPEITE